MLVRPQDRSAATRIGVPVEIYVAERAKGLRWCSACRRFLTATDVYERMCVSCKNAWMKEKRARRAVRRRECE